MLSKSLSAKPANFSVLPCKASLVHVVYCAATNLSLIGAAANLRKLLLELWLFLQRPHIDLRSIVCGRPHEVRQDLCKSIHSSLLATCKPTAHRIRAPPAYSFQDCWLADICRSIRQQAKQESWQFTVISHGALQYTNSVTPALGYQILHQGVIARNKPTAVYTSLLQHYY